MNRRNFLAAMGGGLAAPLLGAAKRPNIVIMLADDMGFSDLACYGSEIATPNLDRLATEALVRKAAEAKDAANASPTPETTARADLLAAQAKLFAANAAWDAADRAVQVYGGRGWSTLYRVGRHLMDVRVCRIYEGTDEILKLKVAAAVLGKEFEAYK